MDGFFFVRLLFGGRVGVKPSPNAIDDEHDPRFRLFMVESFGKCPSTMAKLLTSHNPVGPGINVDYWLHHLQNANQLMRSNDAILIGPSILISLTENQMNHLSDRIWEWFFTKKPKKKFDKNRWASESSITVTGLKWNANKLAIALLDVNGNAFHLFFQRFSHKSFIVHTLLSSRNGIDNHWQIIHDDGLYRKCRWQCNVGISKLECTHCMNFMLRFDSNGFVDKRHFDRSIVNRILISWESCLTASHCVGALLQPKHYNSISKWVYSDALVFHRPQWVSTDLLTFPRKTQNANGRAENRFWAENSVAGGKDVWKMILVCFFSRINIEMRVTEENTQTLGRYMEHGACSMPTPDDVTHRGE